MVRMEVNVKNVQTEEFGALPCLARAVRILLVDHDITSHISLTSMFVQQNYKVTTVESATQALSFLEEKEENYDMVIAEIPMPEMSISEFAEKIHGHSSKIPIILIAKDLPRELMLEAFDNGVCYVLPKPPSQSDIAGLWQHVRRVTGEMPASIDFSNFRLEDWDNPTSDSGRGGSARNQEEMNLKMKGVVTEEGHAKRKQIHIAGTSGSSTDFEVEDGHYSKKTNISYYLHFHEKFLNAISTLGEHDAQPENILALMNEPGLTYDQVASYLQTYEEQKRLLSNVMKTASPVMPAPVTNSNQGNAFNYPGNQYGVPVPYAGMQQPQGASGYFSNRWEAQERGGSSLHYPGNNTANAVINPYVVQVPQGNGGIQEPQGASGYLSNSGVPLNQEQGGSSLGYPRYNSGGSSIGYVNNGWQVPNQGPAGSSMHLRNRWEAMNQEPTGVSGTAPYSFGNAPAAASTHLSNNFEASNQGPAGASGTALYGSGNAGNTGAMNNKNHGEGTSGSGQLFDGLPSDEEISRILQDFEDSGGDL